MGIHDKGYKKLFSKKDNFLAFIETFVKKDWVKSIDPDKIELIDKEFILHDFQEREADVIYKVKVNDEDIYFYLLMELQSTVDFSMPFRLLIYMTELMKRVFLNSDANKRLQKDFKLPSVVPIVLFTGNNPWNVERSFKEYQIKNELFEDNILDFTYILVNLNDFSIEELLNNANLVSAIFSSDKSLDIETTIRIIKAIKNMFSKFTPQEKLDCKEWFSGVIGEKLKDKKIIEKLINGLEDKNDEGTIDIMSTFLDNIEKKSIETGIEQGIERTKLEVAKKALKLNMPIENICELTGLTIEDIEKLKNENLK